ncbi:sensor protein of zinc sigma-54-dependent two-component system [Klebsiella pneumoniae subsp. ozaenae]|uniref:Sensor protein of zinc sigma-54-dependent two-component system n=1 Tax=Klebsiella pneumoniae subsp. ozaenae TaxID=574 RepID=A0A378C4P0_KLEPO|nr:sensor protein of zinc sigma-54-dependent two-component system [Klebsiella pneumoniae subsp. ozaenae]
MKTVKLSPIAIRSRWVKTLYSPAQMRALAVGEQARWRRLSEPQPALEIYRHFRPLNPARGHHMGMMNRGNSALAQATVPQVIFIAFDSRELDAAQARGQREYGHHAGCRPRW